MEKRINRKIEAYVSGFKEDVMSKAGQLGLTVDSNLAALVKYVYDYNRLVLSKEDFMKRKRVKNAVHLADRCGAKRASCEQCTRRKKEGYEYCGTHLKGTPHGICDSGDTEKPLGQKIEVWVQDIQGIVYYIDKNYNVYQTEDIYTNKVNPKIIAKYVRTGDNYSIPEFNMI
jgi:hypothetical protein